MIFNFSKRVLLFWVVGLFVLLLLFFPSFRPLPVVSFSEAVAARGLLFLAWGGDRARSSVMFPLQFFQDRKTVLDENERLKSLVGKMEARLNAFDALSMENVRLQAELGFLASHPFRWRLLAVRVVARDPTEWFHVLLIDKGKRDGVRVDMPVVHVAGLVGRVMRVTGGSAQVLLLSDPRSAVGVVDSRTGELGILQGGGPSLFKMAYLLSESQLQVGDPIVTARNSAYYPQGLLVGTVERVERKPSRVFAEVWVRPAVSLATLDRLYVMKQ